LGGKIVIAANNALQVSNDSAITSGAGDIQNPAPIELSGNSITVDQATISTLTVSNRDAGSILFTGENINFSNGALVTSSTDQGTGKGGDITVNATSGVLIFGGSRVETGSGENGTAPGGDIAITAGQNVTLTTNSLVTAQSTGSGDAGNISLNAGNTLLVDSSSISAGATEANGGNIKLTAGFMVRLIDSEISTAVGGGVGGNINIDPLWILGENSQVLANAFDGTGGDIRLVATGGVFFNEASVINASSELGIDGSVDVQAPIINLSGVVTPLPQETLTVSKMYAERCAAEKGGQFSSFVQGGSQGVPPSPGTFMPSPLQFVGVLPQAGVPLLKGISSGPMVKRLGLEQETDVGALTRFTPWLFGGSLQGCAA